MELSNNKPSATRTIAAFYYCLLSIIATIFIQILLFTFGMSELIPVLMSFVLALPVAWLSGMIFGNRIIGSNTNNRWQCFLWGMFLLVVALLIYDLLLLIVLQNTHPNMYNLGTGLKDSLILYLLIIIYSFVLIGSWLSILSGFAAIFLRDHFSPNVLNLSKKLDSNHKEHRRKE